MDKVERIITQLNVSGCWRPTYEDPGSGFALTSSEVAGLLSGLTKEESYIGWMYLTQDYKDFNVTSLQLLNRGAELAVKLKWNFPKGKQLLRSMCQLSIIEVLSPKLCNSCRGHGQYFDYKNKLVVDCKKCHGTGGGSSFTDTRKAKLLDLDVSNYSKKWRSKYDLIMSIPNQWLNNVFDHIRGLTKTKESMR